MATAMRMCAWCRMVLGTAVGDFDGTCPVTHGICDQCTDRLMADAGWQGFLATLNTPVVAVTRDRRLVAANQRAADLLGIDLADAIGLKAGDVINCVNALTEAGCGNTPDCVDCGIKSGIEATADDGTAIRSVSVKKHVVKHAARRELTLQFSTERVADVVLLGVEQLGIA